MTRVALVVLGLLVAPPSAAQEAALWVEAPGAAAVLVDSAAAGAPGSWLPVAAGERHVRVVDDPAVWNPRAAEATVRLAPGDSLRLALDLPRRIRVETLPIRAVVTVERADGTRDVLGPAPLDLDLPSGTAVTLVARLDGFEDARQSVAAEAGGRVVLLLSPQEDAADGVTLIPTERSTRARTLIDVGLGAATLAAGAVAIHYKFRADRLDDDYRSVASPRRGDPALREEALRLDRYSAVALGAMQVGLGVLAVRFVLR